MAPHSSVLSLALLLLQWTAVALAVLPTQIEPKVLFIVTSKTPTQIWAAGGLRPDGLDDGTIKDFVKGGKNLPYAEATGDREFAEAVQRKTPGSVLVKVRAAGNAVKVVESLSWDPDFLQRHKPAVPDWWVFLLGAVTAQIIDYTQADGTVVKNAFYDATLDNAEPGGANWVLGGQPPDRYMNFGAYVHQWMDARAQRALGWTGKTPLIRPPPEMKKYDEARKLGKMTDNQYVINAVDMVTALGTGLALGAGTTTVGLMAAKAALAPAGAGAVGSAAAAGHAAAGAAAGSAGVAGGAAEAGLSGGAVRWSYSESINSDTARLIASDAEEEQEAASASRSSSSQSFKSASTVMTELSAELDGAQVATEGIADNLQAVAEYLVDHGSDDLQAVAEYLVDYGPDNYVAAPDAPTTLLVAERRPHNVVPSSPMAMVRRLFKPVREKVRNRRREVNKVDRRSEEDQARLNAEELAVVGEVLEQIMVEGVRFSFKQAPGAMGL
ncbi:hypothetical protein DCS_05770 [Drechmeria coniospora]|uniref:Uncharacterized protein n=1 Tax=Drechmeria coniospora TaxID=98403 RepID=A0A151GP29_DRECN|nr:hypothetical protein DCS_05770 [Drechmeria coniospora]KYK58752.1 hypothetical protein DCS_05770 [Drechmeria coniospora]